MNTALLKALFIPTCTGICASFACAQLSKVGLPLPTSSVSDLLKQADKGGEPKEQDRHMHPMFISVGVLAPTSLNGGSDNPFAFSCNNLYGADMAFGYVFPTSFLDLRFSARAQTFAVVQDNVGMPLATFGLLSFDMLFRYKQYYAGPGIGHATSSGSLPALPKQIGESATVLSFTGGMDATSNTFFELRYQTSPVGLYGGIGVLAGIRF